MNLLSYTKKYKHLTFEVEPFNDVDALLFAEMAYINLSEITNDVSFTKLRYVEIESLKKTYLGSYDAINNKKLLDSIKDSERYGDVQIGLCQSVDDTEKEIQFSAVTFILPDGTGYIAYRGTDVSINGIKEDLLIAYTDRIPGNVLASKYLIEAAEHLDGKYYIGGHSKGGNLAVYAGINASKALAKRILHVYSFDGPGSQQSIKEARSWEAVLPKVKKYITNNDLIGVIYNRIHDAKIVVSRSLLLGGHDLFSWQIDKNRPDFVYTKDRSLLSKQHEEALTNWLDNISIEDKKLAVDILSELLGESTNIIDLLFKGLSNLKDASVTWDNYTEDQRKRIIATYVQLAKFYLDAYSFRTLKDKIAYEKEEQNNLLTFNK